MSKSRRFVGNTAKDQRDLVFANPHEDEDGPVPGTGTPPRILLQPGDWWSEFTNEFGEKWVAHLNAKARTMRFYGGDIGWNDPVEPILLRKGLTVGWPKRGTVILNPGEQAWITWVVHETAGLFTPTKASKNLQAFQDALTEFMRNPRPPIPKPKDYGLDDEPEPEAEDLEDDESE